MLGLIKMRAGLLGLLALLLVGSMVPAVASAGPGPFCHHREKGSSKDDGKIKAQTPEEFAGEGEAQTLEGVAGGMEVGLESAKVQVKGVIFNNEDQCQVKIKLQYQPPKVIKPAGLPNCAPVIGVGNAVALEGHKAWTWNQTKAQLDEKPQLEQKPDWIFLPKGLSKGSEELPKEKFTEIKIPLSNCGGVGGLVIPVNGSDGAESKPGKVETWSTEETTTSNEGTVWQHYWNGQRFVPVRTGLLLGKEPAKYKGSFKVKTIGRQQGPAQEIADFEGP